MKKDKENNNRSKANKLTIETVKTIINDYQFLKVQLTEKKNKIISLQLCIIELIDEKKMLNSHLQSVEKAIQDHQTTIDEYRSENHDLKQEIDRFKSLGFWGRVFYK